LKCGAVRRRFDFFAHGGARRREAPGARKRERFRREERGTKRFNFCLDYSPGWRQKSGA
jgi:hypothetical protein